MSLKSFFRRWLPLPSIGMSMVMAPLSYGSVRDSLLRQSGPNKGHADQFRGDLNKTRIRAFIDLSAHSIHYPRELAPPRIRS